MNGTRLVTALGIRPAEAVVPGDLVMTFDHGLQPVLSIRHRRLPLAPGALPMPRWPLELPAHGFGNARVQHLMPEQGLVIESDLAEAVSGDPFVLIPAAALEGHRGVRKVPPTAEMEVIHLFFVRTEVVVSEGNGLYICPPEARRDLLAEEEGRHYAMLPLGEARALVARQVAAAHGWDTRLEAHGAMVQAALATAGRLGQ